MIISHHHVSRNIETSLFTLKVEPLFSITMALSDIGKYKFNSVAHTAFYINFTDFPAYKSSKYNFENTSFHHSALFLCIHHSRLLVVMYDNRIARLNFISVVKKTVSKTH